MYYYLTGVFVDMTEQQSDHLRRRTFLASVGTGVFVHTAGTTTAVAGQDSDEVQATLDNVGARAWEVTDVDGDDGFAEINVRNPDITLRVGTRYTIENQGWRGHPLAFLADDGSALLTQSGDGSFEDDADVNWVDDGTTLSFTVTAELAEQLVTYVCTVHPSMEGSVSAVQENDEEAPAAVSLTEQSTDGTVVTVDSARLDDGGFVTIHDSTLLDGEAIGSVRGVSEYIEAGSVSDQTIELDDPVEDDDTLIAMPHRDSNGNESYDFVESGGDEDPPYTQEDGAVTDSAEITVVGDAATVLSGQTTDGTSVVVDYVRVDDGGFLTIHDSTLLDGEAVESVRGTSAYLDAGSVSDLTVELDDPLESGDTLIAMPHRDSNGNETYDFAESGGDEDPPYTRDGGAVTDSADIEVVDATVNFSRQATASPTVAQDEPTTPGVVADVTATVECAVVVTYEDDNELVVAGVGQFDADELTDEEAIVVSVEDTGGFPGEHVAHAIPATDLSGEYMPGDTVSTETADAVLDNDNATVHQAELTFNNQTSDTPVESGDTVATVDSSLSGDVGYTVDVHVTDSEGSLVAAEWIGSSNVLTGEAEAADIVAERVPEDGEFNELPFTGTNRFVAMIHLAQEGATAGDSVSPGSGPVLLNIDADDGPVPGGVTAAAEVTAEESMSDGEMDDEEDTDTDEQTDQEDGMDNENQTQETESTDEDDSSDGSGPGFGSIAGATGVSSLAAYAYHKLSLDDEPQDDAAPDRQED
jgi:hypothetical protein